MPDHFFHARLNTVLVLETQRLSALFNRVGIVAAVRGIIRDGNRYLTILSYNIPDAFGELKDGHVQTLVANVKDLPVHNLRGRLQNGFDRARQVPDMNERP